MEVSMKTDPALAMQYRCFLDGVDISNDCFAASEEEGWADCIVGELGRARLGEERRHGHVELRRKDEIRKSV